MEQHSREYQKAIQYLSEEIHNGAIRIGDRLPTERALSERLQISRNSTREALRTLENMGLLESVRGSGNYLAGNISGKLSEMLRLYVQIRIVTREEIRDFRRSMEQSVCLSIIRRASYDLSRAEELLSRRTETLEQEAELDRQFHFQLAQASDNRFWIELMNAVSDVYGEWIAAGLRRADGDTRTRLHEIHGRILQALRDRDAAACLAAIDEHYDGVDNELTSAQGELRR